MTEQENKEIMNLAGMITGEVNRMCVTSNINDVLDEIKADIEQTTSRYCLSIEHSALGHVVWSDRLIKESEVLEIIDKYKAEGSK